MELSTPSKTAKTIHAKGRWILTNVIRVSDESAFHVSENRTTCFWDGDLGGEGSAATNKAIWYGFYLERGGGVCAV